MSDRRACEGNGYDRRACEENECDRRECERNGCDRSVCEEIGVMGSREEVDVSGRGQGGWFCPSLPRWQ